MKIKVKKLHQNAIVPKYATSGAACFDLHALIETNEEVTPNDFIEFAEFVGPDEPQQYRTGLSFEIPEGHVMLIYSRSGHGFKYGVRLSNCVGVIDSDYRGEVQVKLHADTLGCVVENGDRIAQAMIVPIDRVEFEEVEGLSLTDRGTGGFGSTGS